MMPYCAAAPMATSRGLPAILLKSPTVRVMPIPNMIIPRTGTISPVSPANGPG